MIDGVLLWKNYDKVLLRCLEKYDVEHILIELHDGSAGGHFSGETTAHTVFKASYYWPILFKDGMHMRMNVKYVKWMRAEKGDLHSHFSPLVLRIHSNNGDRR